MSAPRKPSAASAVDSGVTRSPLGWYGWAGDDTLGVYRSGPLRDNEDDAADDARDLAAGVAAGREEARRVR